MKQAEQRGCNEIKIQRRHTLHRQAVRPIRHTRRASQAASLVVIGFVMAVDCCFKKMQKKALKGKRIFDGLYSDLRILILLAALTSCISPLHVILKESCWSCAREVVRKEPRHV